MSYQLMTAQKYMYEMIDERRASKEERHDLLSRLLEAAPVALRSVWVLLSV